MRVWLLFPCVLACRTTRWVWLAAALSLVVSACGGGTILVDSAEPEAGIKVTELAVGSPNCPSGGRAVTFGNTTQHVCSGNGQSAVVELVTLTAGELNCASGGWRVREGLDANGNDTLDSAEVAHTHSACSGGDGTASTPAVAVVNSLVLMTDEPAGSNCTSAGLKLSSGLDRNGDRVLQTSEVNNTSYACGGADALMTMQALSPSDAHCTHGGTQIVSGADNDGSGKLLKADGSINNANASKTHYVCNGAPGIDGSTGALINSIALAPGHANCLHGGAEIITGLNNDGTGILVKADGSFNATNPLSVTYACNGAPGSSLNLTGATQQMASNAGYIAANDAAQVVLTLPAFESLQVGDIVRIQGAGRGGWRIAQNAGQNIDIQGLAAYASLPGATWTLTSAPTFDGSVIYWEGLASSSGGMRMVAAAWDGGIYTSVDGGVNWVLRTNGLPAAAGWVSVASSSDGTRLEAHAWGGGIYTSADGGETWSLRANGVPTTANWCTSASSADGMRVVVATYGGAIYTSADGGTNWTLRTNGLPASAAWCGITSSSDGMRLVSAAPDAGLYTSGDAGATWTRQDNAPLPSTGGFPSLMASSSDGTRLSLAVRGGGIYVSNDAGASWTQTSAPAAAWTSFASSSDGTRLVGAAWNGGFGGVYTSVDGGATWTFQTDVMGWLIASTPDGTRLVATDKDGRNIYTSSAVLNHNATTTAGSSGGLVGGPNDSIELQFLGNGRFGVLSAIGTSFVAY